MTEAPTGEAAARALDAADPLREFRGRFELPLSPDGTPAIYFCSNSLGAMPRAARSEVGALLEAWATLGVRGHETGENPWIDYHAPFAAPLAALVGADPAEVVAMNSLTVNLHLLLASFYRPTTTRHRILIEQGAFPSDRYAVVSQLEFHGRSAADSLLEVVPRADADTLSTESVIEAIERAGASLALVLLPGVQYLTGEVLDLRAIGASAAKVGAAIGWDLAHAIGNVPLALHDSGADFAVWCSYKYLCGGPGAVAGAFVHARHGTNATLPRFAGWWGHDAASRFAMPPRFRPMPGAEGWQLSNPPVLALAPLKAALAEFEAAGIARLRAKSLALTRFARAALERRVGERVEVLTPAVPEAHGAQLSLKVRGGAAAGRGVHAALGAAGVIGDWREPDVIRLAPAPLYNTFGEVERAIGHLAQAVGLP